MSEIERLFDETFIKESISEFIRKVYVLLEVQRTPFRTVNTKKL
jgi:hypothetical protein